MDRFDELSAEATKATSIYLLAQERAQAIDTINWAFMKLREAYSAAFLESEELETMHKQCMAWQADRKENLDKIAREYRNKAALLVEQLSGN